MPFKITIELSDRDLRHFQRELRKAHASVRSADDEEIIGAAAELLTSMRDKQLPDFVALRLDKLGCLLEMLQDTEWPVRAMSAKALGQLGDTGSIASGSWLACRYGRRLRSVRPWTPQSL